MPNVWPNTLPDLPMFGYKVVRKPNVVSNETAEGPPETRRRGTKARQSFATPVEFTGTEKDIFDDFFINTLADGTLDFETTDFTYNGNPGRTAVYNFMGNYPEFTQATMATSPSRRRFEGSLLLEYKGIAP